MFYASRAGALDVQVWRGILRLLALLQIPFIKSRFQQCLKIQKILQAQDSATSWHYGRLEVIAVDMHCGNAYVIAAIL